MNRFQNQFTLWMLAFCLILTVAISPATATAQASSTDTSSDTTTKKSKKKARKEKAAAEKKAAAADKAAAGDTTATTTKKSRKSKKAAAKAAAAEGSASKTAARDTTAPAASSRKSTGESTGKKSRKKSSAAAARSPPRPKEAPRSCPSPSAPRSSGCYSRRARLIRQYDTAQEDGDQGSRGHGFQSRDCCRSSQRQGLGQYRERRLPQERTLVWQDQGRKIHDRIRSEGCWLQRIPEKLRRNDNDNDKDNVQEIHNQNSRRAFRAEPDQRNCWGASRQEASQGQHSRGCQRRSARHQLGDHRAVGSSARHRSRLFTENHRRPSLCQEDRPPEKKSRSPSHLHQDQRQDHREAEVNRLSRRGRSVPERAPPSRSLDPCKIAGPYKIAAGLCIDRLLFGPWPLVRCLGL